MSLLCKLKKLVHKGELEEKDLERIVIVPKEQEPCDCISRKAVLEAFNLSEKTRKYGGDHSGYNTMMLYEIQDVIEDLPSIQPKTDVLDKIRAEIKEESKFCPLTEGLERALEIIDKYKAESEDNK